MLDLVNGSLRLGSKELNIHMKHYTQTPLISQNHQCLQGNWFCIIGCSGILYILMKSDLKSDLYRVDLYRLNLHRLDLQTNSTQGRSTY